MFILLNAIIEHRYYSNDETSVFLFYEISKGKKKGGRKKTLGGGGCLRFQKTVGGF